MKKKNINNPEKKICHKQYVFTKESDSSNEDNSIEEDVFSNEDNEKEICSITKEQFDKDRILDQLSLAPGKSIYKYIDDWGKYNFKGIIKFICNNSDILHFGEFYFHFLDAKNTKLGQNLANILTVDLEKYYKFSSMDYSYFGIKFKNIKIRPTKLTIGAYNLNSFAIFGWDDLKSDWALISKYVNFDDGKIQTFDINSTEKYSIFVLNQIAQGKNGSWGFSIAYFDIDGAIMTIETDSLTTTMNQSSENDDKNYLCDLFRPGIDTLNDELWK